MMRPIYILVFLLLISLNAYTGPFDSHFNKAGTSSSTRINSQIQPNRITTQDAAPVFSRDQLRHIHVQSMKKEAEKRKRLKKFIDQEKKKGYLYDIEDPPPAEQPKKGPPLTVLPGTEEAEMFDDSSYVYESEVYEEEKKSSKDKVPSYYLF